MRWSGRSGWDTGNSTAVRSSDRRQEVLVAVCHGLSRFRKEPGCLRRDVSAEPVIGPDDGQGPAHPHRRTACDDLPGDALHERVAGMGTFLFGDAVTGPPLDVMSEPPRRHRGKILGAAEPSPEEALDLCGRDSSLHL